MSDRVLGACLLVAASLGFAYYTVWALALPFVDAEQPLHALFPPRHLAVALPAAAIAVRLRERRGEAGAARGGNARWVDVFARCGALRRRTQRHARARRWWWRRWGRTWRG